MLNALVSKQQIMNALKLCEIKMKILVASSQFHTRLPHLKSTQKPICYKTVSYIALFSILKPRHLVYKSNRQSKNAHDAVHGLVFPSHCTTSIRSVIPETGTCSVKTGSIFLHDDTGDDVLERFSELGQLIQTLLDDIGSPLIHFVVLVGISADSSFDRLFDNVANLVYDEGCFFC